MCRRVKILRLVKLLFIFSFVLLSACSTQSHINEPHVEEPTSQSQAVITPQPVVEKDLWRYIVNRSTLQAPSEKQLFWHIDWFKKHPEYLARVTKRANPYLYLVTQEVERAGLPLEIALLPIVESAYYPWSYSHGTASGLWQFIPSTGRLYGLKDNWWYDARGDVLASTKAAVKYLKNLNKLFKGDWLLAIAAYNSGPGRVQKAIRNNKAQGKPTDFWHLKLPKETQGYVPRLLAVTELIRHPKKYGQSVTSVVNEPVVQSIKLDTQFDLALISEWAEVDLEELYTLNPALKRWATPATDNYTLLLPNKNMALFKQAMKDNPNIERLQWIRYQVRQNDSLSVIAQKYQTTISHIISVNKLKSNLIKVGDYLIVPVAQKDGVEYLLSESQREKKRLKSKKSGLRIIHTVGPGDSLWLIAKKYHVNINRLVKWNHLKRSEPLKLGKKLVLWQPYSTTNLNLSKVTDLGINIDRKVSYRVKNGDNLSVIAAKFGVNIAQIKQWNNLNEELLQPGQRLTIMVNMINTNMK